MEGIRLNERLLVRPGEAGELLSICRSKVYELIASGELPSVKINGGCTRVPVDGLRAWIAKQGKEPENEG